MARLARRDYVDISTDMSFRFRDVYDHLVRIADDATIFQDRVTGVLDAHLTSASNRLNEVMKVLTVVSTIFMPLTLLSGLWGMNIMLPRFPGGDAAQFWWISGIMVAVDRRHAGGVPRASVDLDVVNSRCLSNESEESWSHGHHARD